MVNRQGRKAPMPTPHASVADEFPICSGRQLDRTDGSKWCAVGGDFHSRTSPTLAPARKRRERGGHEQPRAVLRRPRSPRSHEGTHE